MKRFSTMSTRPTPWRRAIALRSGTVLDFPSRFSPCRLHCKPLSRDALLEGEGEVFRGVGCLFRVLSQFPHIGWGCGVGVFKDARFVGAVCEVLVHAPGFALCACDGDLLLGGVVKEVIAAGKALVEFGNTPGSDDFNCGLEGVKGEFEADLVVALI